MAYYFVRRRSTREVNRLEAIDEHGTPHNIIERISILHDVGASGQIFGAEYGSLSYYSATSGDVLVRLSDEIFETKDKRLLLKLKTRLFKEKLILSNGSS
jgi:hypothetical protein